jgi:hypothetical protein
MSLNNSNLPIAADPSENAQGTSHLAIHKSLPAKFARFADFEQVSNIYHVIQ